LSSAIEIPEVSVRARWFSWVPLSFRSRLLTGLAWSAGGGLLLLTLYGWLWPARWEDDSRWFTAAAYGAFIVRTLWFHMAVGAVVLAAACVLVKRRRAAVLALPAVLLGFGRPAANLVPESEAGGEGTRITVMTANILYRHPDPARIVEQIEANRPDIVFFQEYDARAHAILEPLLAGAYPYRVHAAHEHAPEEAVFSRIPLSGVRQALVEKGILNLVAVADVNGTPVTLQSVHLRAPMGLGHFAVHRAGVAWFKGWLPTVEGPLILAGDFNSVAHSQTGAMFRGEGLHDAFASAGSGLGWTWPAITVLRHLPGFRIDRVLYRGGIRCERAWVGPAHGSDHRPVYAELVIPAR